MLYLSHMTNVTQPLSLEELTRVGAKFYFDELKEKLEKEHFGEYAVIDVAQKKYTVDPDRLAALEKAQAEFGEKLFYIVHIGNLQHHSSNFSAKKYAWIF